MSDLVVLSIPVLIIILVVLLITKPFNKKPESAASPSSQELENALLEMETETESITEAEVIFTNEPYQRPVVSNPSFAPHAVESTLPSNLIEYTEVMDNGNYLSDISQYQSPVQIDFASGDRYTQARGVIGFRGDNFRNSPVYGYQNLTNHSLSTVWSADTGGLSYGDSTWTGSGWTGQPLIVQWPAETRRIMNLYPQAKEKEDLVEVIYACMDGYIYFLDLKTGERTRDPLYTGFTFKGSGALDPRGYPILYVGSGYDSYEGKSRVFVISLIDGSIQYTFGNADEFCLRGQLSFFDASPLVDAETDTLIYPGENGILYLVHLNTQYDPAAGTLSVNPDRTVKWHYWGKRSSSYNFWLGMEDSPAIYKGYIFMADNGGHLMCLDLNTLKLVWVQDILDDSNSTPVLSVENDHLYLYVSTSFRLGWRSDYQATVPVWKIDAETGEIVWQKDYECFTEDGVSGGVQSTIALGINSLEDYVYVTVARTGTAYGGVLACLRKADGQVVWEHEAYYAWSSPVCLYDRPGNGIVLYADCSGKMYLLDGISGQVLNTISISDGAVEASPAVYDSMAVIGTRACKIWGIEIS